MNDEKYIRRAILLAEESKRLGDYAIGSVIVKDDKIVSEAGNRIRTEMDATSHTEVVALRMASRDLASRYLTGCTLYSTHAPCPMCLTACVWAKVDRVVYGARQSDIEEFGNVFGTDKFKWRAVGIEPRELYERYLKNAHPGMEIKEMLRDECKKLFHV